METISRNIKQFGQSPAVDIQLIRTRLLNALACPTRIMMLETTIASLMLNRESVGFGLDALAEFLGYDNRKSVSRLLDESATWQRAANVSLCTVLRGERNVRRVHQFISNKLNAAAFFVVSQLESNPDYNSPTLARIDQHTEVAIQRFLRQPLTTAYKLAAVPQSPTKRTMHQHNLGGGGSVISWDIFGQLPHSLSGYGMRFFPIDAKAKKPRIWNYQQGANGNPVLLSQWKQRWPDTDWAILTGTKLEGGGFFVAIDFDRHGEKFGDGFKTYALRVKELGELPETFTVGTPGGGGGEQRYFRSKIALPTWSKELGPGLDCKGNNGGLVVAPGAPGYVVKHDLPIVDLPESWQDALNIQPKTKQRIAVGERHNYLRRVSYAMACQGKQTEQIVAALRERLWFNCEPGGRTLTECELLKLARSARAKIDTADRLLNIIVA